MRRRDLRPHELAQISLMKHPTKRPHWWPPGHTPRIEVLEFEGVPDLLDFGIQNPLNENRYLPSNDYIETRGEGTGDTGFNRVRRYKQAIPLVRRGWPEGLARLQQTQSAIEKAFMREVDKRVFTRSVEGFNVDVPAFLANEPEHMIAQRSIPSRHRQVTIGVDLNVRCSACGRRQHDADPTDPLFLLIRGSVVASLVKYLHYVGMTPRVIGYASTRYEEANGYPAFRVVRVPIHEPQWPFNMDRVNFTLAHEAMIRKLEFRVHEILNSKAGTAFDSQRPMGRNGGHYLVGMVPLYESHLTWNSELHQREEFDVHIPGEHSIEDYEGWRGRYPPNELAPYEPYLAKGLAGASSLLPKNDGNDYARAAEWLYASLEAQGVKLS